MAPDELLPCKVVSKNGNSIIGEFRLWHSDPAEPKGVRIELQFGDTTVAASADGFWDALVKLRRNLEQHVVFPYCYGSSRNVHASGMSMSSGLGDMAYKLFMGSPGRRKDMVRIFDVGDDIDVATVEEQEEFYSQWLKSFAFDKSTA